MSRRRREVKAFQKRRAKENAKQRAVNERKGGSVGRIDWLRYR